MKLIVISLLAFLPSVGLSQYSKTEPSDVGFRVGLFIDVTKFIGRSYVYLDEDFIGNSAGSNNIGKYGWAKTYVGTPSGTSDALASDMNEPWEFRLTSGTTSGAGQVIRLQSIDNAIANDKTTLTFVRFRIDVVTGVAVTIGFTDVVNGDSTNLDFFSHGFAFQFDPDSSANLLFAVTRAGSRKQVDLGAAAQISAGVYYNAAVVVYDNAYADIYFGAGDSLVYVTRVIPVTTFPITGVSPMMRIVTKDATNKTLRCGYFFFGLSR